MLVMNKAVTPTVVTQAATPKQSGQSLIAQVVRRHLVMMVHLPHVSSPTLSSGRLLRKTHPACQKRLRQRRQ